MKYGRRCPDPKTKTWMFKGDYSRFETSEPPLKIRGWRDYVAELSPEDRDEMLDVVLEYMLGASDYDSQVVDYRKSGSDVDECIYWTSNGESIP